MHAGAVTDQPDPLDLSRLSARMDAEVRAEQADYERMALRAQRRARDLAAVARDLLVRGDEVEVRTVHSVVRGVLRSSGKDVAVLDADDGGMVDVRLHAVTLRVVQPVRLGGRPPGGGPTTFLARMTEHEIAETTVRVLLRDGSLPRDAIVSAVGRDHLWLREMGGIQCAVPIDMIAMVRTHDG